MKSLIMLLVCGSLATLASAQTGNEANGKNPGKDSIPAGSKKTEFIVAMSYNSNLNYYGRTDSVQSIGYFPTLGVNFKNGLYLHSSFVFISNALYSGYAASIVESGYRFGNRQKTWAGNIFVNKFFYKDNTDLLQSALKGTAGVNLANLNKIVNVNAGADLKLSDKVDIGASFGLDHIFRIEKVGNGVIVLDPSAYAYGGTQKFSNTYYTEKKFLLFPAGQDFVTTSGTKFSVLSYELSCPVIYGLGKMNLILTPSWVLPQNLLTVAGRPDLSERGKNLFYLSATMKFTF
ncbi:MAG: hypothetical protein JST39_25625 [Bacteroidetes bacterium]|nr:hypothetical protein [Bacteroidota bacterium]